MLIHVPSGRIETIPEADRIFSVVPRSFEEAQRYTERGLFAYLRYGCGSCRAAVVKIGLKNTDRLLDVARTRRVSLVYVDLAFLDFEAFAQGMMVDTSHAFVLYRGGEEVVRHTGFPFADDLAKWIEDSFPIQ